MKRDKVERRSTKQAHLLPRTSAQLSPLPNIQNKCSMHSLVSRLDVCQRVRSQSAKRKAVHAAASVELAMLEGLPLTTFTNSFWPTDAARETSA